MFKDITFGQYIDSNSVLHRLDPRTKSLLLIVNIVVLFLAKNFYSLAFSVLFLLFLIILSKVPLSMYLKNIKAIWIIIAFTAILNLFLSNKNSEVLVSFWKITITYAGLSRAVFLTVRIIVLILISSILTYTTTPNDLTDAIESLLKPLKFIGLKNAVHTVALMMTIALRFIPTLVDETNKIINAQKSRGADFENGKFYEKIKALVPILVPLLISSIRRAYDLAEAMECRCYNNGIGRVKMKQLKYRYNDLTALVINIVFICGVIALNILLKQVNI
ncbi:MAG: energy-coupling factor transporter transmembrane protein EcfT [Clostridia bacterium]|nr:energy-coupling factor transporter transmembrane protein EcfT [Clostridia bacterium]